MTENVPLRVAVIGSGPTGFYVTQHLFKEPDLAVEVVRVDRSDASAGDMVQVVATVTNVGADPVSGTPVSLMLSTNPAISPQDVELGMFSVSLMAGESTTETQMVTLPANINSGTY